MPVCVYGMEVRDCVVLSVDRVKQSHRTKPRTTRESIRMRRKKGTVNGSPGAGCPGRRYARIFVLMIPVVAVARRSLRRAGQAPSH